MEKAFSLVTGFLGGFGLPIMFSWIIGAVIASFVYYLLAKK